MKNIHDDIERVLFTSEELVKRAEEIGRQITQDYKGEEAVSSTHLTLPTTPYV